MNKGVLQEAAGYLSLFWTCLCRALLVQGGVFLVFFFLMIPKKRDQMGLLEVRYTKRY